MRILLIDTDEKRADALEISIASRQPDWRLSYADTSATALTMMASDDFDVVVAVNSTEVRAVAILRMATKIIPSALRIAVAENALSTQALINAGVAHRAEQAPLLPEQLVAAITQAGQLESLLSNEGLRKRIASIDRLPPAPGLAMELMRDNAEGTACMATVAQRLRGDPVFSAKLLQLSNSSYYTRGAPVLQIERALMRLGMDAVTNLVLILEMPGGMSADAQTRAACASHLAKKIMSDMQKTALSSTASTAATLADIGQALPLRRRQENVTINTRKADEVMCEVPIESAAGAYLLSRWGLPLQIVEAVAYRHKPALGSEEEFGVVAGVHVACALAKDTPVDEELIQRYDIAEHLRQWRAEAERFNARPQRPPARSAAA
ncbi:MAG TPA: HDOD domain-containing protein [Rudaea sp.]|jgi:HD-like signal output (HDOD) protein|nr:HDOD domain-containing protein [Rudaea sp.]